LRRFTPVAIDALRVVDAADYRRARVDLVPALLDGLRRARVRFLVPCRPMGWDRIAFLNLGFWTPGGGELLPSRVVAADELCHVAWHRLARRHLGADAAEASLLGEAIASAFDVYLVGRLLAAPHGGRTPALLATQVPRMAEHARDAGLSSRAFERLLERIGARPEWAWESLRALLYDAAKGLCSSRTIPDAARRLGRLSGRPLAPLLHHYELSTWLLHARVYTRRPCACDLRRHRARRRGTGTAWRSRRREVRLSSRDRVALLPVIS
jgi:hypothetical protein